ncbi:MAG: DNA polymerase III subunit delta' [Chloroflexi bacterium]|nr:DNA polymerase III subunit delta' [Chloroflexota bacterium]
MWQVVGQDRAISLLQRSLEKEALAHAYLLVGPPHVGKMTLALDLAKAINCDAAAPPCGECTACRRIASGKHADVQIIGLAGDGGSAEARSQTEISIDQIRQMQHSACLPPFEGRYKVFIIEGAELLSNEAANCLLKTLEEPEEKVVFLLLTAREELLPATIVSRCQRLELPPLAVGEVEAALNSRWAVEQERARLLARLCHGRLGWALLAAPDDSWLKERAERIEQLLGVIDTAGYEGRLEYAVQLAAQFNKNRGSVQEILDLWLDWWHDLLLVKIGCVEAITNVDVSAVLEQRAKDYSLAEIKSFISAIQSAGKQLKQNANPQLVFEVLMLSIPGRGV